uniref:Uncharacterized protein n=1 Tax=Romanomermis culicivorax TaxID=13658 RepID=A0A915KC66_ROMCU
MDIKQGFGFNRMIAPLLSSIVTINYKKSPRTTLESHGWTTVGKYNSKCEKPSQFWIEHFNKIGFMQEFKYISILLARNKPTYLSHYHQPVIKTKEKGYENLISIFDRFPIVLLANFGPLCRQRSIVFCKVCRKQIHAPSNW